MIVVGGLPAHIDHGVDRRRAADHLAARIVEAAAVEAFLRLGLEAPVRPRIADCEQVTDRNVKPYPIVAAARFEHQHTPPGIGGQPIGEEAAGGTCADDNVVVLAFAGPCFGHANPHIRQDHSTPPDQQATGGRQRRRRGFAVRFFGCYA